MKKILSITLAVLMVLTVLPFAAFAAPDKAAGVQSTATPDAQITTNVCSIWYTVDGVETKHADYANLDAAFDGMRDLYVGPLADTTLTDTDSDGNLNNELYAAAGSPVIKLNGNFQGNYVRPNWATDKAVEAWVGYDANKVPTFVIDGAKNENENYTITYGTSSSAYSSQTFNQLAYYNLTVKNTNMVINSGANTVDGTFLWNGNDGNANPGESWTIFENCVIKQNSTTTSGSGCLFKMNGKAKFDSTVTEDPYTYDKYNLILKDTQVEAAVGLGHQAHWGVDANIELYNSTMGLVDVGGDASNNNDALLKFYEAGVGRVYMDGTSKLFSRREDAGATVALIRVLHNQKAGVTVELEEGAELAMMNTVAVTEKTYIADGGKGMLTLDDKGAIYSASAIDAKTGVNLPLSLKDADWYANGVAVEVAHPTTVTTDEESGEEVYNEDTTKIRYTATNGYGAILTTSDKKFITIEKAGAAVEADITDLNQAFDYVYGQADSKDYTIKLAGDVSVGDYMNPETYDSTDLRTVTIDGQDNQLWAYNPTATFYGIGLYNLVLSNVELIYAGDQASSLDWSPRKTPSDSYGNYIATGSNPVVDTHSVFTNVIARPAHEFIGAGNFKLKGGNSGAQNLGAYGIKLVDSEFTSTLADTMFMMNDKGNLDLDIIGTTINYIGGANYTHLGNNSIIIMNGAAVDINIENSANNVSVLNAATRSTPATCGIFANHTSYNVNVTLGKDVELYLSGNSVKTGACFFAEEKATTTITDNGAKWIVSKDLLDNGATVSLPASMFKDSEKDHAWYVDDEAVANPYLDATVTADVTLTHAVPVDPAEGKVAYIELDGTKTYYATLGSAITAVGALYDAVTEADITDDDLWAAAGSPVITLYDDITITSETYLPYGTYDANRVRTLVIKGDKADGTNPVITSTNEGAAFAYNAYYNLTLENIDLDCTKGFALFWRGYNGNKSGKSTTNMINCNISATGTSGEGLVFKVTGNQNASKTENYIINMENTHIEAKKGVNAVFLFHHGCAGTLNIDGNSSIHHVQNKSSAGGDTMFMLGTNRQFTVNVANGAELSADVQVVLGSGAYKNSYAIFRCENSNTANYTSADGIKNIINIEDGANLTINADDTYTGKVYFIDNNLNPSTGVSTVLDLADGATMALNAKAASLGFAGYKGYGCDEGAILGSYLNGDTTKLYNSIVPADAVTTAVSDITPVFYNADDFAMVDGASLRTVWKENGIRFTSTYTDALAALVGDNAQFGTVIVPTKLLGTGTLTTETADALVIESTKSVDGDGETTFHAAVIMNPEKEVDDKTIYELELAARGYMTVTYADGSTATFYTAYNAADNARSMYTVAKNLADQGVTNPVIEGVIATCEAVAE